MRALLTDPLLHFAVIGLALVGASELTGAPAADPKIIRVDAEVHQELAGVFEDFNRRAPTAGEMNGLVERWLVTEVLYREALALDLGHGDPVVRERLIAQMRAMLLGGVAIAPPSDAALRAWVAERADRYGAPARVSFRLIELGSDAAAAAALARRASAQEAAGEAVDAGDAPLLTFANRSLKAVGQRFGAAAADLLARAEPGVWTAVQTPAGWGAAVVDATADAVPPDFDRVRTAAQADWRAEQARREAHAALAALMADYAVERTPFAPDAAAAETTP